MSSRTKGVLRVPLRWCTFVGAVLAFTAIAWTGSASAATCAPWRVVASPTPTGVWSNLQGVAAAGPRDVWAVGRLVRGGFDEARPISMRWDGRRWTLVPVPTRTDWSARLAEITRVPGTREPRFWAVGDTHSNDATETGQRKTFAVRWNGRAWVNVPTPNVGPGDNWLLGVAAVARNDVWAVGAYAADSDFEDEDSTLKTLVLHWDGAQWKVVPSPSPPSGDTIEGVEAFADFQGVAAVGTRDVWAVGGAVREPDGLGSLTAHWNGTRWREVETPGPLLFSVDGLDSRNAWAVGSEFEIAGDRPVIMRWNGERWQLVPAPAATAFPDAWPTPRSARLEGVSTISPTKIWAVGTRSRYFRDESGAWQHAFSPLIMRWNGSSWKIAADSITDSGSDSSFLRDVTAVPGTNQEWAVGNTETGDSGELTSRTLTVRHC